MAGVTIRVEFDDAEVRRALDRLVFPARAGMNRSKWRRPKMRRKMLPDGTFTKITDEEARRTFGAKWLSHTYPIHPESMTGGWRALLDRMQSAGPGRVVEEVGDGQHPDVG